MANFKKNYVRPVYEGDVVVKTVISMYEVNGSTIIEREVAGDHLNKGDEALQVVLLEQVYNDFFPNRAENEKFDKLDKLIKEANDTLETTRKALASSGMAVFENQSELEDVQAKLEFLAKHLNVKYPTDEEEVTEVTNNEEATNGEGSDV